MIGEMARNAFLQAVTGQDMTLTPIELTRPESTTTRPCGDLLPGYRVRPARPGSSRVYTARRSWSCRSRPRTTSRRPSPSRARRSGSGPPPRSAAAGGVQAGAYDLCQERAGPSPTSFRSKAARTGDGDRGDLRPADGMSHTSAATKVLASARRGAGAAPDDVDREAGSPRASRHHRAVELPLPTGISDAVPALMAGTQCAQPATDGALAALRVQVLEEAGCRRLVSGGVWRGPGRRTHSHRPCRLHDVHRSTATGRVIGRAGWQEPSGCCLELGARTR